LSDYLLSIFLGVIEGLTEFLPVSSTAHLRIAEAALHMDLASGYWKMFSIVIQLGAILTLPIYFRRKIANYFGNFPVGTYGDLKVSTHPITLTAVAFVCTAGPAFVLTKVIGKNLENIKLMAMSLIIGGIVMWIIDSVCSKRPPKVTDLEHMGMGRAIVVGLCQVLAPVIPGTSRSMATIASAQVTGMSRPSALEFSFLLSIPTMAAATLYDFYKSLKEHVQIDNHGWLLLAIGFAVSFIVAFVVVAWFMAWVRKKGFAIFAVWRILVGIAVLLWLS
jgi:undecaprenyl-diphosphatase